MFALGDALAVMEAVLLEQLTGSLWPDPAVLAAAGALSRGVRVGEVAADLGLTPGEYLRSRVNGPNHLRVADRNE